MFYGCPSTDKTGIIYTYIGCPEPAVANPGPVIVPWQLG